MTTKIEIKNWITGSILFEFKCDGNSILKTLLEAVRLKKDLQGADLRGADLQGADLRGAYLQGADLRGADLQGADLRDADLRGAYLQGADLQGADLRGADIRDEKIKAAVVFTGLYYYMVMPYITEAGVKRVKMGCHDLTVEEWDANFWNNDNEFPNDGSAKSQMRLMAYNTAKEWLEIVESITKL